MMIAENNQTVLPALYNINGHASWDIAVEITIDRAAVYVQILPTHFTLSNTFRLE